MIEYEIRRSGILYFMVERNKNESVDGNFYDNIEDAYRGGVKYLRSIGCAFILSVPVELFD